MLWRFCKSTSRGRPASCLASWMASSRPPRQSTRPCASASFPVHTRPRASRRTAASLMPLPAATCIHHHVVLLCSFAYLQHVFQRLLNSKVVRFCSFASEHALCRQHVRMRRGCGCMRTELQDIWTIPAGTFWMKPR